MNKNVFLFGALLFASTVLSQNIVPTGVNNVAGPIAPSSQDQHIPGSLFVTNKVGIGTSTPTSKLQVIGDISSDGSNQKIGFATTDSFLNGTIAHYGISLFRYAVQEPVVSLSGYYGLHFFTEGNERMKIAANGNIGIGTANPSSLLTVAGTVSSREVKVTVNAGADFVFDDHYDLPSLEFVAKFIKENKHLPQIASAEQMKNEGINLSEMNIKLLQKTEELTLYLIQQNKEIEELKAQLKKILTTIK